MYSHLLAVLAALNMAERQDDKFTAMLEKQLEAVKARTYDIRYPEMRSRRYVPTNNETDPGAETITYRQWDEFGMAQIIANYADDLPQIDALVEEYTQKVHGIGASYSYSIQDLRRSAMAGGMALDQRRARSARRAIEQQIDNIAALGNTKAGLKGFAKHPNVPLVAPDTGTWSAATADQIIGDLNKLATSIVDTSKEVFEPDTLLLPVAQYNRIATLRISSTGDTHTTVLEAWLRSNPWVTEVASWNKLATADAAGTGPRAVCYKRDPEVVELEIPQEFEQLPPQAKNLSFNVPVHARIGGVIVYYPIGMAYMDGI